MVQKEQNREINWDELGELSGENTVKQIRYVVPVLKFNGSTGKFGLLTADSEGNLIPEEIGEEVEGVILKIRRVFTAFVKTPGGTIRYFTNEHNSWKDSLVLFERRQDAPKPLAIDEGMIKELRTKYPELRLRQNLYFLFKDQIVKLGVRGKSLSSLFDYYNAFGPREHLCQFVTKIQCHEETNEGGLTYWVMDFLKDRTSEPEIVNTAVREVAESLAL